LGQHLFWIREDGLTKWTSDPGLDMDPIEDARLFLLHLASDARIRPIYELLSNMAFYNPQPDQLRAPVEHDVAPRLSADGRNTASILGRVQDAETDDLHGVLPYLKRILPGLEAIKVEPFQGYDHLSFVLRQGDDRAAGLVASQMSDGTLRALAVLVALFQGRLGGRYAPSLVGVEEPENTIHPAAARILLAAMQNASYRTQVLATTHSADMLHMGNADMRSVLVVAAEDGITKIGPIDAVSQGIVRDNIYTLGELLQMDQLFPEPPAQAANGDAAAHQPAFGGA
jgi:predicted ATPase